MMASLSDLLNTPDYSHQLTKSWLRLAPEYRRANCNWIVLRQHQNAGERGIDIGLEITIIIMAMEDWASYKVDHDTGCVGRFSSEFEERKTAEVDMDWTGFFEFPRGFDLRSERPGGREGREHLQTRSRPE